MKKIGSILCLIIVLIVTIPLNTMADTKEATVSETDRIAIENIVNTLRQFKTENLFNFSMASLDSTGYNFAPKFNEALGENYSYKICRSNWYKGEYYIYYTPYDITQYQNGDIIPYVIRYNTWEEGNYIVTKGKISTNSSAGNVLSDLVNSNDTYVVNYDSNGSDITEMPDNQCYYAGSFVTISSAIPVREGYEFIGWSRDKEQEDFCVDSFTIISDITLYAQWKEIVREKEEDAEIIASTETDKNNTTTVAENRNILQTSVPNYKVSDTTKENQLAKVQAPKSDVVSDNSKERLKNLSIPLILLCGLIIIVYVYRRYSNK